MKKTSLFVVILFLLINVFSLRNGVSALSCAGPFTLEEVIKKGHYEDYFIGTVIEHDDKEKITVFEVEKGWGNIHHTKLVLYGDKNWGETFQKDSKLLVFVTPLKNMESWFLSEEATKHSDIDKWGHPLCSDTYSVKDANDEKYKALGTPNNGISVSDEETSVVTDDEKKDDVKRENAKSNDGKGIPLDKKPTWLFVFIGSLVVLLVISYIWIRRKRKK